MNLLTVVSDRIARAVSKSGATRALVIDISWFDHAGLFHRLRVYWISGQVFGLISSFFGNRQLRVVLNWNSLQEYPVTGLISPLLSNRQLRVVLNWKSLQEYSANTGVSQSSILDPTFFISINDLPDIISNIAIYADYTTLYSKIDQAYDL